MPSKSPVDRLLHIRDSIYKAKRFTSGMAYEDFRDNDLVFYAVTRCLEIIPVIPRREMAGAGNVYRHDYEDVRQRLVWGTVQERFPALLSVVEQEPASEIGGDAHPGST